MYPETAPRGSSAEQAVKSVLEAISRRIKLYEPPYQGAKMGAIRKEEFATRSADERLGHQGFLEDLHQRADRRNQQI